MYKTPIEYRKGCKSAKEWVKIVQSRKCIDLEKVPLIELRKLAMAMDIKGSYRTLNGPELKDVIKESRKTGETQLHIILKKNTGKLATYYPFGKKMNNGIEVRIKNVEQDFYKKVKYTIIPTEKGKKQAKILNIDLNPIGIEVTLDIVTVSQPFR